MKISFTFYHKLRKLHRNIAPYFLLFLLLIATTGMLLGSKKIFYQTVYKSTSTAAKKEVTPNDILSNLPLNQLKIEAISFIESHCANCSHHQLEKIELRIKKKQINYVFKNGYTVSFSLNDLSVQEVVKNNFPQLLHLHDGSILEDLGIQFPFKQIYTLLIGFGILIFSISGIFLWYQFKTTQKK